MKSAFRSRRHRNPPQHNEQQQDKPFFSKSHDTGKQPFFNTSNGQAVQTKLSIGQPGDAYEQEADAVADRVVNNQGQAPVVQRQEISSIQRATLSTPQEDEKLGTAEARMEEDKLVQEKPDVQMQPMEEEEPVQMQSMEEEEPVQMQHDPLSPRLQRAMEEEEPVQMQAEEEEEPVQMMEGEEEEVQMQEEEEEPVQMQYDPLSPRLQRAKEEEEPVQMQYDPLSPRLQRAKEEEEPVQMMEGEEEEVQMQEEEEEVQMKAEAGGSTAGQHLSSRIQSSAGKGRPLPGKTRAEMENAFGVGFDGVNVHTDAEAVQMNKALGAQAFTHGKDVYFNSGKYRPESAEGKRLLAHELTHVVQQSSSLELIQRYGGCSSSQDATITADHLRAMQMLNTAITKLGLYNGTAPSEVFRALSLHFSGSTSAAFAGWIKFNLQFLRLIAQAANYQCETIGGSSWACTSPNTLATAFWCVPFIDIRLCPSYFSQSDTERSTTLIHEWVHKYGCNFDLGYEHEGDYGGNATITQLLNADSFAHFVKDVQ
jgi:myosin heavy subunit